MTLSRLTTRDWSNNKLSDHTKVNVYKACVISTLLYGSESWTMCAHQEKWLNAFHMRCLRRILGITWRDKVTNKVVLEKAGIPSLYTLLKQRRMRLLGHVTRMKDGRIPKDLLYGELAIGKRPTGRPQLRFNDVCKRDLQALGIHTDSWAVTAIDRDAWRHTVKLGLSQYEETQQVKAEEKRLRKKTVCLASRPTTAFTCSKCGKDCHSRIGLHSHNKRSTMSANLWYPETDRSQ